MGSEILLCVGNHRFRTTHETLSANTGFFSNICRYLKPKQTRVFIDRDGTHFRHVLNYLRGAVSLPTSEATLRELLFEADYYGLDGLMAAIQSHLVDAATAEGRLERVAVAAEAMASTLREISAEIRKTRLFS